MALQTAGLWADLWLTDLFSIFFSLASKLFFSLDLSKTWLKILKASLVFFINGFSQGLHSCFTTCPIISSCSGPSHSVSVWPWSFQSLFQAQGRTGCKPGSWSWTQKEVLDVFCPSVLGLLDEIQDSVKICMSDKHIYFM